MPTTPLTDEARARKKAANKKYYEANHEKRKAHMREYNAQNLEKNIARRREYRRLNNANVLKRERAEKRRWRTKHPEEARAHSRVSKHRRRARLKALDQHFTVAEWREVLAEHGYKCIDCGVFEDALRRDTGQGLTVGHMLPLCRGGANTAANLRPQCFKCNRRQGSKPHHSLLSTLAPEFPIVHLAPRRRAPRQTPGQAE